MQKKSSRSLNRKKINSNALHLKLRKKSLKQIAMEKYNNVLAYIIKEEANEIELMIASTQAYIERK